MHQETYGKTGCRRVVPGQFLASDPKGRAIMCAAVEKQKLVYVMNRDASNRLTISSPLEAHKASTLVLGIVGVDVGFDNPVSISHSVYLQACFMFFCRAMTSWPLACGTVSSAASSLYPLQIYAPVPVASCVAAALLQSSHRCLLRWSLITLTPMPTRAARRRRWPPRRASAAVFGGSI